MWDRILRFRMLANHLNRATNRSMMNIRLLLARSHTGIRWDRTPFRHFHGSRGQAADTGNPMGNILK